MNFIPSLGNVEIFYGYLTFIIYLLSRLRPNKSSLLKTCSKPSQMYSAYSVPSAPHHSPNVSTTTASSATLNSTTTTWSSSGSSMHPTYTSFDPGPSTSGMYGGQGGVFSFPPYPSMHMPFDYQQVGAFSPKKNLNKLQINLSKTIFIWFTLYLKKQNMQK